MAVIAGDRKAIPVANQAPPPRSPPPAPPVGKGAYVAATEPAAPQVSPIKAPTEAPQPALSNIGFPGGINEFNSRVQKAHDAFLQIHGYEPTPGLVLDIARSPVMPEQFSPLLQPTSATQSLNQKAVQQFHQPGFVTRPDGHREPINPVAPISQSHPNFLNMQKQHPWVAAGMLPIPNIDAFWHSLAFLQNNPDAAKPLLEGGMTVQQYQRENDLGAQPGKLGEPLSTMTQAEKGQNVVFGVSTVKEAQDHLASIAPEYFGTLPKSGFINQDWAKAISQYTSSAKYFKQQTEQLASDNHFGGNTAAFIDAWKAKQAAIKKSPLFAHFLSAQPLAAFSKTPDAFRNYLTGNTKGLGWINVPTWGLNVLTHTVGIASTEIGASLNQVKADASAASAYLQAITPKWFISPGGARGKAEGEKQAREAAVKALAANPTWARALDPTYETDWRGAKVTSQVANLAIDLLISKPGLTGESVGAGDIGALKQSRYFNTKTTWAYNTLATKGVNGVAEAAKTLEGGLGAEQLVNRYAEQVATGQMSLPEFQQRTAELYAHGATADGEVTGSLLNSLRGKGLPTKTSVGTSWQAAHSLLIDAMNDWEKSLLARKQNIGKTSNAVNFVSSMRQAFARAAPGGGQHLFEENLPGDIYNWTMKNLKDRQLAETMSNDFVRARASGDVAGMAAINDRLAAAYREAHPGVKALENPLAGSEGPLLESEQRTYFRFPSTLEEGANRINQQLNALGAKHRQVIVGGDLNPVVYPFIPGGGESLMWKHVAADTTRRIAGGGGPLFGMTRNASAAKGYVADAMTDEPALARLIGVNRSQAIMGEQRWITGQQTERVSNFDTGEHLTDSARMKAAGGYLRHRLSSNALKAYQASSKDDLGPLINLVLKDRNYRSMMGSTESYTQGLAKIKASLSDTSPLLRDDAIKTFNRSEAHKYAESIFQSYGEIEKAGTDAGLTDPFGDALGVLVKNVGPKSDKALGQWIKDNQVNFPVTDGLVENGSRWDTTMSKWIGVLMSANKWNRAKLFDHVFYNSVHELKNAGWETNNAVAVSASLAKAQTIYHMLDFSNMLQVEQDLRWLSYFATKHRLYWQWVGRQVARHPGSAAVINDVGQHLDNRGNLPFKLFGKTLSLPAARLFWANSADYPQTSPIIQALAETGKGMVEGHGVPQSINDAFGSLTSTSGNVLTRNDQAWMMAAKTAGVAMGTIPASAAAVTFGMTPSGKRQLQEQVNQYGNLFHAEHGTWPSEADAVKHVLLHATGQTFWNSNLPLPVTWSPEGAADKTVKAELDAYGKILDPKKKRAYLDSHPEVALRFGITKDPAVFLHNAPLWDKFNTAQTWLKTQRAAIWQSILKNGYTTDTKIQMKGLSAQWQQKIEQLKMEDAATWQGSLEFPAGKISDGQIVTSGPWGVQLEGDPFAARAFIHQAFPGVPQSQLDAHTVGERIIALQDEAARLRGATTPAKIAALGYPDAQHVRDRLSQINQTLAPFFAYPKDSSSQAQSAYYTKFVGPYIAERDKRANALKLAPTDQQDALRSEFRAWKDQHDHPVVVDVNGRKIKFPSVVQIGWATLPADQKHIGLAGAVSGDWAHIASYEKTMLGIKTAPDVSQGWAAFADAVRQYSKSPANPDLVSAQKIGLAKQIDKVYPGFYKDFLFSMKPKVERFQNTILYRQMPERAVFDQYVTDPAKKLVAAIKANGNRNYYSKAWRNYVETEVMPWLDSQPTLKKELADYGPDFLNTLVAN